VSALAFALDCIRAADHPTHICQQQPGLEFLLTRPTSAHEIYQHGHHASVVANHAKRTADTEAKFFLPLLRPGMRLLDVGCGPGSITSGLAKRVAPAETIGIDASSSVIETARSLADASLENLSFEVGNIYQPRFAAETFDAVFAHQVLQHLRRPVDALSQMQRLLKPGSMLGVREVDWGSATFYPENDGMRRFLRLYYELAHRNGGEPNAGRFLRRWFREAGFTDVRVTTSTTSFTDQVATREWADTYAERTLQSNIADKALEYGLASRADLESMAAAWRTWGANPDALYCFSQTEVVARRAQ
jgi:ubiquinone/menaquinone biosynthesis C-methylase UbiE